MNFSRLKSNLFPLAESMGFAAVCHEGFEEITLALQNLKKENLPNLVVNLAPGDLDSFTQLRCLPVTQFGKLILPYGGPGVFFRPGETEPEGEPTLMFRINYNSFY
ncbi:MAG: hypothetical protein IH594_15670 [Bacteroidales bacterium]|nr:hypothetical protein [Bacteroidales bacterium]